MDDRKTWLIGGSIVLLVTIAALFLDVGLLAVGVVSSAMVLGLAVVLTRSSPVQIMAPAADTASSETMQAPPSANLGTLVLLCIAIRLIASIPLNLTGLNLSMAPDSVAYTIYGELIAISWQSPGVDVALLRAGYDPHSFYQHLNALVYTLVGSKETTGLVLSLVNAFVSTAAFWVLARLANRIYGPVAARRTFILCAFFPSILLWTSINLRDSWSFLIMALALNSAHRLRSKVSLPDAAILVASMLALPYVRSYMVILLGLGIVLSYLVVRIRQIPVAIVALIGLLALFQFMSKQYGVSLDLALGERLATLQTLRSGLAFGDAAVDTSIDISTPTGALLYFPRGLANFLLSPFPWSIRNWRQGIALLETLFWYFVLYQACREIIRSTKSRLSAIALPLFVVVTITVAYALVEGNEGTAYRHRAHSLLILFIFAGGDYARRYALRGRAQVSRDSVPLVETAVAHESR